MELQIFHQLIVSFELKKIVQQKQETNQLGDFLLFWFQLRDRSQLKLGFFLPITHGSTRRGVGNYIGKQQTILTTLDFDFFVFLWLLIPSYVRAQGKTLVILLGFVVPAYSSYYSIDFFMYVTIISANLREIDSMAMN